MYQDELSSQSYYGSSVQTDEDAQELAVRLGSLCRVYEQTDRVLTGDPVQVHVVNGGPAPAWSDGSDIYINKEEISEFDLNELVQINGLNYHELAHHLYTPRKGTTLMQWVMEQTAIDPLYMMSANALEDQRIETLFTARYPAIVPYLTKTVVRWLAESPEAVASNYICIRGRQYLPLELRVAFRDMFYKPELIPVIADIVDEYRTLHFPKQYADAQRLIKRFKEEVLDQLGLPPEQAPDGGPSGCGKRSPVSKGRPEAGKAQERDSQRAKGQGNPEPEYTPKPAEDKQPSNDKGDSDDESDVNNVGRGPGSPGNDGAYVPPTTVDEALALRETEQTPSPAGNAHAQSLGGIPDDILDIIRDIEQSIYNRKDVQTDVKTKQRVIIGGDGKHDDNIKRGKYSTVPVPPEVLVVARRFARELEKLKQDCEPNWEREQSAGRLNVQRVISGADLDKVFDRWDDGVDGTDIETVMLVDRSGSMGSYSNDMRASEASWVIKRSMEQIKAPVTIYAFDGMAELVASRDDKVDKLNLPFIYGSGGTDPKTALVATERLFRSSKHKTKIMFLITDGEFNHYENDDIVKRLNAMGVVTVMILIADPQSLQSLTDRYAKYMDGEDMWHECTIHGSVTTAADLIPFAKQVVTNTIKKALNR